MEGADVVVGKSVIDLFGRKVDCNFCWISFGIFALGSSVSEIELADVSLDNRKRGTK